MESSGRIASGISSAPQTSNIGVGTANPITASVDNIPIDLIYYFNIDISKIDEDSRNKLKDIGKFYGNDRVNMVTKISELERKLGCPFNGETRQSKVWNHIRISKAIKGLELQREALYR